jgi:hypothetical protein
MLQIHHNLPFKHSSWPMKYTDWLYDHVTSTLPFSRPLWLQGNEWKQWRCRLDLPFQCSSASELRNVSSLPWVPGGTKLRRLDTRGRRNTTVTKTDNRSWRFRFHTATNHSLLAWLPSAGGRRFRWPPGFGAMENRYLVTTWWICMQTFLYFHLTSLTHTTCFMLYIVLFANVQKYFNDGFMTISELFSTCFMKCSKSF